MNSVQPEQGAPARTLPSSVYAAAGIAAFSIGNLYYSQPLLPQIAGDLALSPTAAGFLPAITQIGFATGIVLVLPLADLVERRRLAAIMLALAAVAVVLFGLAGSAPAILCAAFGVGITGIVPQLMTPYAARLAPRGLEGRAVGLVLSAILGGVLVSKAVAGFLAGAWGWQALYFIAGGIVTVLALLALRFLPASRPERAGEGYLSSIRDAFLLLRHEPLLRRYTLNGALAFAAFMAFWSTYALHLHATFGYGPDIAGLFGLAGTAGIFAASLAGRQVDRGRFNQVCAVAGVLMSLAFVILFLGRSEVLALIVGAIVLDAGMALCHAANQTSAFALRPEARGRINTVYMSGYFLGGAIGTGLASLAYRLGGWDATCLAGLAMGGTVLVLQARRPLGPRVAAAKGR